LFDIGTCSAAKTGVLRRQKSGIRIASNIERKAFPVDGRVVVRAPDGNDDRSK
jgi:hypothetical protein